MSLIYKEKKIAVPQTKFLSGTEDPSPAVGSHGDIYIKYIEN